MHLVDQYKQFASDYRRPAAMVTKSDPDRMGQGCRKSRGDAPQQKQRVEGDPIVNKGELRCSSFEKVSPIEIS
jgi:hypothetical protein